MSAEPIPINLLPMRRAVARLADQGFRVLRVRFNDKIPVDSGWPERATDNENVLDPWFMAEYNIGVACGPQPNGINLVVIDVDIRDGGMQRWTDLVAEHGVPDTRTHTTPSGGLHVFFDGPDMEYPAKLPGHPGIDIRRKGHQVVVPPSTRIIEDTVVAYAEIGGPRPVRPMPEWLVAIVTPPPKPIIERSITTRPSTNGGGLTNADWFKDHYDFVAELEQQGYTVVGQRGDEVYLRHPEATSEKSCTVHVADNWMHAYSSNMPSALRAAAIAQDGGVNWSAYDWWVRTTFDGDYSAATREINRRRGPFQAEAAASRAVSAAAPAASDDTPHQLPGVHPDYWSASARNAHVLAAARAAMVSPDALDLVVFALESLLIPPNYLLPAIVGGRQPLNMLACLVANTGLFKTSTLDAARDLMGPFPPWVVQIGMGTGEGIGSTFLKDEMEPNAKGTGKVKTGRMVRNDIQAAFFEADEGRGMSEQARRQGATIIANLCKAWSGSTLGEANADPAKRRHVLDRDYRIAALVNIQPTAFDLLFSEANTGTGLTGRFMFSGTLDPDIPDERGVHPGLLEHPDFAKMPVTLEIDDTIIAQAEAEIRRRHRTASLDTRLDAVTQNSAVIARMAGIACLVDNRQRITTDDWAVATLRAEASAACLSALSEWHQAKRGDERLKADVAKAMSEVTITSITERQFTAVMAERIRDVVATESWAEGKLRKKLTYGGSKGNRHRFDPALALAVSNGWVKVVDGRIEKV